MGVVTMNDLIECIVGEFNTDDTAEEEATPEFEQIDEDTWVIRCDSLISDVIKKTGARLPDDEGTTLSGYILGLKGIIPEDGTTFDLETDTLMIKALQIKDHTVEKAEIYIKPTESEETEEAEALAEKQTAEKEIKRFENHASDRIEKAKNAGKASAQETKKKK
jgi:putative hemolysin